MSKYSIILERNEVTAFFSNQSVGTDALNALRSIPGVENLDIVTETKERVELTYSWVGDDKFWTVNEHLAKFGLIRADVK